MQPLSVPASLESLAAVEEYVKEAAEKAGLAEKSAYNLRLAASELASNVILYGFDGKTENQTIHLSVDLRQPTELRLIFEDAGKPFDLRNAPPPKDLHLPPEERKIGGLGIFLILENVDHVHYERVGNINRNILTMKRPNADSSKEPKP